MYTTRSSEIVKLCSALGEDIFDSLISVTPLDNLAKKVIQFLFDVAVTCFYALIHAFVILLHVITLNVSINSNDAALLIVLVSSNFAEVKGSAFKRFSPQNLFQVSAADIVEMFQLSIYLLVIWIRNIQYGIRDSKEFHIWTLRGIYAAAWILGVEACVDWVKHVFITKFNQIDPLVYSKLKTVLCADFVASRALRVKSLKPLLDKSHVVAKRIGFVSIPLCCIVLLSMYQLKLVSGSGWYYQIFSLLLLVFVFLSLFLTKVLLGITLLGHSIETLAKRKVPSDLSTEVSVSFLPLNMN